MHNKKVRLFTLQTFSSTGGIQKMTRTLAHSLNLLSQKHRWDFKLWSAYDEQSDLMPEYIPEENFRGFAAKRLLFILNVLLEVKEPDLIVLSHVNLAVVGLIIKNLNPKCEVWLIAHGIEVWRPFSFLKKRFLAGCDKIVCVSNFTMEQLIVKHGIEPGKCAVLNNAVDSLMNIPDVFDKPAHLLNKYGLKVEDPVVFTLTRLASSEQYKGHDHVIRIMGRLIGRFPKIKYLLAGQYDRLEEIRIRQLISQHGVDEHVILKGFVEPDELTDYFLLADLFVLPSKKEGFGIVFIEALACGLPVICGNVDGSLDAIDNGKLGNSINPDDEAELENAMVSFLQQPLFREERSALQQQCLASFNETEYRNKLEKIILND